MLSLGQYKLVNGYQGTASFLTTTQDQISAFLRDESVIEFLDKNPNVTTNSIKNTFYKKYFRVRNRKKATGFEALAEKDLELRSKLKERIGDENTSMEEVLGSLDLPDSNLSTKNFLEACIDAAHYHKQQADIAGKKIFVCMSGGLDSEITALSFKLAEIEFTPFIVDYKGLNDFDTSYAIVWCAENKITPFVHVLDIEEFFNNEIFEYADKSRVTSPQILTYQKIMDVVCKQYNAYIIMGGEIRIYANAKKDIVASYAWDKWEKPHRGPEK